MTTQPQTSRVQATGYRVLPSHPVQRPDPELFELRVIPREITQGQQRWAVTHLDRHFLDRDGQWSTAAGAGQGWAERFTFTEQEAIERALAAVDGPWVEQHAVAATGDTLGSCWFC